MIWTAKIDNFPPTLSQRQCLAAVASRDSRLDGRFVYAVRSTGIYCCPSCPSRRPRPPQVRIFATPEAAEQAGFRPCLRCHPQQAPRSSESRLIRSVCDEIRANTDRPASLRHLAAVTSLSPYHLQRTFRQVMGITPRQYADATRTVNLKSQLRKGDDVTTALYKSGYASASRVYEHSDAQMGMTPGIYRQGGRGMKISYVIADCSVGRVLVAETARGISAVSLGENDEPLVAALHEEYPRAEILRGSSERSRWVLAIVRRLDGFDPQLDLPTDVMATAFQRRVWEALRAIPFGTTRSYREVACAIGRPTATRAVARACATNPTAIVVPCHRVIRTDGALGGYRWGLRRKELLLAQESRGAKCKDKAVKARAARRRAS